MAKKAEQTEGFTLPAGKVTIELIEKRSSAVIKDTFEMDAYTGSTWSVCLPQKPNGELVDPLTTEERLYLEEALQYEPGTLSIHKDWDNNFYLTKKAILEFRKVGKNPKTMRRTLDKQNPYEYLLYKIALASPIVAPSWDKRFERAEYIFVLKDRNAEFNEEMTYTSKKSKVLKYILENENNKKNLYDLLRLIGLSKVGGSVSKDSRLDWLYNEIMKLTEVKERIIEMYEILTLDADTRSLKVLLADGLSEGVITFAGGMYKLQNGDVLGSREGEVIAEMNKPERQDLRLLIEQKASK